MKAPGIHLNQLDERIDDGYLVMATGARHTYSGHDDWEPFASVLKTAEGATAIRRRVLSAYGVRLVTGSGRDLWLDRHSRAGRRF